jgi:uncharacterized protein YjiS (DUF1127 family)
MSDIGTQIQTTSLLSELRDARQLSAVEAEAYARRLRAQAIASGLITLAGAVKRGWQSFAAEPPAVTTAVRQEYTLRQLEADVRYQRAEAFAEAIYQVVSFIERLAEPVTRRVKAYLARQAAMAELYGLDDRTLYDMGLSRSEIPAAVMGNIYRPHAPQLDVPASDNAANENAGIAKVQVLGRKVVA